MGIIQDLQARSATLEAEIRELKTQGIAERDYSLDSATRRGNEYHRLRWMDGEKRMSKTLPDDSVGEWRGLVERRRQWKQKIRQLEKVQQELAKAIQQGKDLGLI